MAWSVLATLRYWGAGLNPRCPLRRYPLPAQPPAQAIGGPTLDGCHASRGVVRRLTTTRLPHPGQQAHLTQSEIGPDADTYACGRQRARFAAASLGTSST